MPERHLILNGKIATMDAAGTVFDDGYLFIKGARIVAVTGSAQNRPAGFEQLGIIRTGGTLFPGLMEMHNHLPYNILPMWEVDRRYAHRGQWRSAPGKRKNISTPMAVLGAKKGLGPAIARYVEAKCLLGGTTTTQGITLFSAPGIKKHFKGVTRNVEAPLDDLPKAATKVPDVSVDKLESFHKGLKNSTCFLLHLSEGIGEFARKHFLVLQKPDGTWALERSLAGIHSTGLQAQDFERLAEVGASIVWSPLSNLLLYGGTTDVAAAKAAGVNIALGSDWSPSGSKNLLAELKIAKSVSDAAGGIFSDAELVRLATGGAVKALQWEEDLGSLEAGKLADVIVLSGRSGDPYARLLSARETSLSLVMIGGVARAGSPALFARIDTPTEEVRIGGSRRSLRLFDDNDEMRFAEMTLDRARRDLSAALADLPALQEAYEAAKEARAGGAVPIGGPAQEEGWFLFDDDEEHEDALSELGLFDYRDPDDPIMIAAGPVVTDAMALDPLTTVEDRGYYHRIRSAHNVPAYLRTDTRLR